MKKIAVIGGGASGLIAAHFAASAGSRVTLFERQKAIGRKLLVTGNGRCNISNTGIDESRYHGRNPRFTRAVFSRFGLDETREFFASIGIPFVEEELGRLFPASLQASTVTRVFEHELAALGVDVRLHRKIDRIVPQGDMLRVVTAGREEDRFDAVILAAGSCAYPQVGGSRSGYELAASLGHRVHEPFPAIVPLTIPLKALHRLEGIKRDCALELQSGRKVLARAEGELLFTRYGLSGPAALDLSRAVNERAVSGSRAQIVIDLFPHYSAADLSALLDSLFARGDRELSFCLSGILHHRIPEVLLGIAGIDPRAKAGRLNAAVRKKISSVLKSLRLDFGPPRSFSEAVVAAGGVDVDELSQSSCESKIVRNLYMTGELLDIDGDSGGFNLQFAWSTGALAGMAASG